MPREERPPEAYVEALSRRYGRLRLRTVDFDLRARPVTLAPRDDWGSVVLVAVKGSEAIALVRRGGDPPGFYNFPMASLAPGARVEEVAEATGARELGLRVRFYKLPAIHIVRFRADAGVVDRWHFIAVARVVGEAGPPEPGTEVTYSANPMALPRWRESDWHYWILRDAELAI